MNIPPIDKSQRTAAKVVGLAYLITMATAVFAFYQRGQLVVAGNVAETARNITAHETLFRLSIASDLITFAGVVALIAALYVVLEPVDRNLALFAAFLRAIGVSIGCAGLLNEFDVLRFLSGAEYLRAFEAEQLQALARLSISAHGAGTTVDFVFLGLGSTVFCYLWVRSKYIPTPLAALGVLGSAMLAAGSLAIIVFPGLAKTLSLTYMMPLGIFEVTVGFWLLVKGLRPYRTGASETASA